MKNSIAYAYPTIIPVASNILFIFSRCPMVIMCCMLNAFLTMIKTVETIPNPEKIAPATKYGGKIVVCHPGITETAKSKLTIV